MILVEAEQEGDSAGPLTVRLLPKVKDSSPEIRRGVLGLVKIDVSVSLQILRYRVTDGPVGAFPLARAEIDGMDSAVLLEQMDSCRSFLAHGRSMARPDAGYTAG